MRKAFTLIELLVVVVVIAVLAAIAVPNFMEAQTRSKTSKAKADMRSLATAVEAYGVDYGKYPPSFPVQHVSGSYQLELCLSRVTTPVAYMSSVSMLDPFGKNMPSTKQHTRPIYMYYNYEMVCPPDYFPVLGDTWTSDWAAMVIKDYMANDLSFSHRAYVLWSAGPDQHDNNLYWCDYANPYTFKIPLPFGEGTEHRPDDTVFTMIYDPTNGTSTRGDLARLGGNIRLGALAMLR